MEPLRAGPDMEGQKLGPQNPHRGSARPEFVPKLPPRRRQRGALPSLCPMDFELSSRQDLHSAVHTMEEASAQIGLLPQPKGAMANRQNTAHQARDFARGAANMRWQRAGSQGGQAHQRTPVMPTDGHTYLANRKETTLPSQGKISQVPVHPFDGFTFQRQSSASSCLFQNSGSSSHFMATKASFEGMWHQLEADIQSREGMLMDMKADMDKCASLVKISKLDASKEKKEAEATLAAALETSATVNKQTQRIKRAREDLELISTDLSVQVAELNLLVQQVQNQQRVLELFEHLKEHYDATENENRIHMDKSLQECEIKLATMEKELARYEMASENLEKTVSGKMGNLQELEAGSTVEDASLNKDASQIDSKVGRPIELHECGKKLENAVLKVPKLEPAG